MEGEPRGAIETAGASGARAMEVRKSTDPTQEVAPREGFRGLGAGTERPGSTLDLLDEAVARLVEKVEHLEAVLATGHERLFGRYQPPPTPTAADTIPSELGRISMTTRNLADINDRLRALCELAESLSEQSA